MQRYRSCPGGPGGPLAGLAGPAVNGRVIAIEMLNSPLNSPLLPAKTHQEVFNILERGTREEVRKVVMEEKVRLGMIDPTTGRTLLYKILTTVTNGDKIVLEKLKSCVTKTGDDPNREDWAVVVDHSFLVDESPTNIDLVKDLLDLPKKTSCKVLDHPVIRTFIESRWRKTRFTFFFSFLIYLIFVLLLSGFIWLMYQRDGFDTNTIKVKLPERCDKLLPLGMSQREQPGEERSDIHRIALEEADPEEEGIDVTRQAQLLPMSQSRRIKFRDEDTDPGESDYFLTLEIKENRRNKRNRANRHLAMFGSCESSKFGDISLCCVEFGLLVSIIGLLIQELWQMVALGKVYFREMENWFELLILSLASCTLAFKSQTDLDSLKIVSAVGICFSWIQLIFLLGRYPFLGGNFSIMYYAITKRIIRTVLGFFILIWAFTFGFFIIHFNHETESFDHLGKSFIKVFVMILGEFEFDDLWKMSGGAGTSSWSRFFTMVLLVFLILFGTVTMVNLIVAIIITDIDWLKKESRDQILLNQAQHAIRVHKGLSVWGMCFCCTRNTDPNSSKLKLCLHSLCKCGNTRPEKETRQALMDILGLED